MTTLSTHTLKRWQRSPIEFITEVLRDPETGNPFVLLPAEIEFLKHCFKTDDDGRLLYPEMIYSAPKKSGKTTFGALLLLTTLLLYGGKFAEAFVLANDLEQSIGRIFTVCVRIVEASPLLHREARITADKIVFPKIGGASVTALANDFAGAAGAIAPVITAVDEPWAMTSERSRRTFDEMVPTPTRRISCRLLTSYAGFAGESTMLEEIYKRGLQQQQISPNLYAGDGLLMFWSHEPIAPWQSDAWLAEMRRSLRPNQYLRMIENRFVVSESGFTNLDELDRCFDPNHHPTVFDPRLQIFIGIDASVKRDSTALAACAFDTERQCVKLIAHRIIVPSADNPIDFEGAVESQVVQWANMFRVRQVLFDPFQMVSSAQRLTRLGIKMQEFPQTVDRLTASSQNLFELIRGRNLVLYPDSNIRLAFSRAIAVESARGWRISKEKQAHGIDIVVALAMSALAAVRAQKGGDLRLFCSIGGQGLGPWREHDPRTGAPLDPQRGRLLRNERGQLVLVSNNRAWSSAEQQRRRYY